MTSQPPVPPAAGFLDQPDGAATPEESPLAGAEEALTIHGAEVIDATKVDPDKIGETENAPAE